MKEILFIWFGRSGCHILVWHVAFSCTQRCPAIYPLCSTGMSPGLWRLTFSCSNTCVVAKLTRVSQSQKAGGAPGLTETGMAGHMLLQVLSTTRLVWKFYLLVTVNKTWWRIQQRSAVTFSTKRKCRKQRKLLVKCRIMVQITCLLLSSKYKTTQRRQPNISWHNK